LPAGLAAGGQGNSGQEGDEASGHFDTRTAAHQRTGRRRPS
jgi:hypothetical protein